MSSMRSSRWGVVIVLACAAVGKVFASSTTDDACLVTELPQRLIDVDGKGRVHGAWSVPTGQLIEHLQRARLPTGVLLAGYDILSVRRVCTEIGQADLERAHVVFGGREWLLARQGASAWEWLVSPVERVATNLLSGRLSGIFVGPGKVVIGQGLERSTITDPARMAAWLIDNHQARMEPVVLFVEKEYQQSFLEFFSNNPLPGVFLSFDDAERVKETLNRYASISQDDQVRLLDYYCK